MQSSFVQIPKYNKLTIDGNGIKSRAIHSIFGEGEKRLWIGYYISVLTR